jgi:hypothetical protein
MENDVVDWQSVTMEMEDGVRAEVKMECITDEKDRMTVVECEHAVIYGDETIIEVSFRDPSQEPERYDFLWTRHQGLHAGADLLIIKEFIDSILSGDLQSRASASASIPSHLVCFQVE